MVPTSRVAPDVDFAAVAFGPTLLQRRVDKRADIRLTAVGDRILAARKAVAPDADPDDVDVRFAPSDEPWRPADVPPRIAEAVRLYLREAELAYGAFDFAEDVDGIWWFLECNQSGQFGFIEMDTGQPIARSVAEWLAGKTRRHHHIVNGIHFHVASCLACQPRRIPMAVPKRKMSRSNTRHRRSQWKATTTQLVQVTVDGVAHMVPQRLVKAYERGLIQP